MTTPYKAKSKLAESVATVRRRALNRTSYSKQNDKAALKRIAKAVRSLRYDAGWTQDELAQKCGCSFKQISNIERAQNGPSPLLFDAICRVFGVEGGK